MNAFNRSVFHSRMLTLGLLACAIPFVAAAEQPKSSASPTPQHAPALKRDFSPLVDKVRKATARYRDINVAIAEGWAPATPCVSGPNEGAMGVHFTLEGRIGDGVLNPEQPELLIYEPMSNGAMRLVGVEFVVIAKDWQDKHPKGPTPALDGHLTNFVGEPNRYGLPAFYEIHVWAWERNPNGNFADWNTMVSCDKKSAE